MTQFNFTTNIEKRMPATGKVYCIDRMTSDYAEAHPLDVDAFIESVYQEFADTEFGESHEVLRSVWNAVLSDMNPRGDASLYPNKNGQPQPAAMKVWHKACDYWRRGLRLSDTLPDMVPMTKITRLDDGSWIALFPKDMHLLTDETTNCANYTDNPAERIETNTDGTENHVETEVIEVTTDYTDDTFERPRQSGERLTPRGKKITTTDYTDDTNNEPFARPEGTLANARTLSPQTSSTLKAVGMVAAATVALLVIYETGLLIPLGLIGLATGGILK